MELLNGMHEGILILTKTFEQPSSIMFCNRPAHKLVKTFLDQGLNEISEINDKVLRQEEFYPLNLRNR